MERSSMVGILVSGMIFGGTFGAVCEAQTTATSVVEVEGKKFLHDDLPQEVRSAIYEAQHESYEKIVSTLKDFAMRLALAQQKDGKVNANNLPSLLDLLPPVKVEEATIKAFFEANKERAPAGTTYEQVKPQIEQYLVSQSVSKSVQAKMAELEKAGKVKILLKEPLPPLVTLDLENFPSQGPKNAAVTLVEVTDYRCGHCQNIQPQVEAILKEFAGKIRFVQINFALDPAGLSGFLAQGAYCAQKQSLDGFWKFHREAFGTTHVPSVDALKETLVVAGKAGVNNALFEKCLGSDEAKAFVDKSVEKMSSAGVTQTPSFFVNGRKLAHPNNLKESVASALEAAK